MLFKYGGREGFTLLELVVAVVIIGLLVSFAVPRFTKTIESAKNKEAITALRLLRTAERMYYIDYDVYYPSGGGTESDLDKINQDLNLALESADWTYSVNANNSTPSFTANATRSLPARNRTLQITHSSSNITCTDTSGSGFCP